MPVISPSAVLAGVLLFAASAAQASSFDCTKAASPSEKAICNDPYTAMLDGELGERWRVALAQVADPKALKLDQRQWLKTRDQCAADVGCLRRRYLMRITELGYVAVPFNWTATWQRVPASESDGAELQTRQRGAGPLDFDLSAASGGNSGDLQGQARLQGGTASFAEADCQLKFVPLNGVLQVEQAGGDCGAGMGVYYAGRYVASKTPLKVNYNLLDLGLLDTPQQDRALRQLLKDDYSVLVQNAGSITSPEPAAEMPGAKVQEMWLRGLASSNAAILMTGPKEQFWLVLLVFDAQGQSRARYYSNVPAWKGRMPATLQRWYEERAAQAALPLDVMP